jgi:hypothetical protein
LRNAQRVVGIGPGLTGGHLGAGGAETPDFGLSSAAFVSSILSCKVRQFES